MWGSWCSWTVSGSRLKSGEFRPVEVRQVMIPKGVVGETEKVGYSYCRGPGRPNRLKAVLEPIFEADFLPCSYGFRPNRRTHDAIAEIHHLASRAQGLRLGSGG